MADLIDYHNHPQAHRVQPYTAELLGPWAEAARARGLREVAFTDHDRYVAGIDFAAIDQLRETHPDLIFLAGLELDNDPVTSPAGLAWVKQNWARLDYVLGSVHYLPGESEMFDQLGRGAEFATRDFARDAAAYVTGLEALLARGHIDALAHLDLIKIHRQPQPESGLLPFFREVLAHIAQAGLALEISTAGWRKPVGELYPTEAIVREAVRLEIPFTLASDAHAPAQLAENYDRLPDLLRRWGVQEIATYRQHRRTMIAWDRVGLDSFTPELHSA